MVSIFIALPVEFCVAAPRRSSRRSSSAFLTYCEPEPPAAPLRLRRHDHNGETLRAGGKAQEG
jgi:hypothetical protein